MIFFFFLVVVVTSNKKMLFYVSTILKQNDNEVFSKKLKVSPNAKNLFETG